MTDRPAGSQPFVLPVGPAPQVRVDRSGRTDFYHPAGTARTGAILFVPGVPGPAGSPVTPRDQPLYQGYATLAARRGVVAAVVDHGLVRGPDLLTAAADDVEAAVGALRADPRVDPQRVALWFFSQAGLLAGEWLDSRPEWLRCLLLSYPLLVTPPGADELVSAAEVIGSCTDLPVLLTRVGRERAELAGAVAEFVSAAGAALDLIDVPKGQHGFDMLDHTEESRAAVTRALDWAIAHLGEEPAGGLPHPGTTTTTLSARTPATAPSTAEVPPGPASPDTATPRPAEPAPAGASSTQAAVTEAERIAAVAATAAAVAVIADGPATPATRVVDREHATYAAHDLEAFLALYSPTATLQSGDGSVLRGRRSLREHYGPRFEAGRCKSELRQRMAQGDWVVEQVVRHESDRGPEPALVLYRVQDGLVAEVRFLS